MIHNIKCNDETRLHCYDTLYKGKPVRVIEREDPTGERFCSIIDMAADEVLFRGDMNDVEADLECFQKNVDD